MFIINRSFLFIIQFFCLILATTLTAGGGQFPGNSGTWLVYLKFLFLLIPVGVFITGLVTDKICLSDLSKILCDHKFLLFYLVLILLSVPLGITPAFSLQRSLYTIFAYISLFSYFAQYSSVTTGHYRNTVITFLLFLLIVLSGIFIASPYDALRYAVQYAGLVHPNMLSSVLAQLFLCSLFLLDSRIIKSIALFGLAACIILLQSRGIWISLGITLIMALALNAMIYRSITSILMLFIIIFCGCITVIVFLLYPALFYDFISLFTRGGTVEDLLTLTHRTELWSLILKEVHIKEILIGHGYAVMAPSISTDFGNGILFGAHNGYLSIFLGSGIISLIVLILYWLLQVKIIYKNRFLNRPSAILLAFSSVFLLFLHACVAEEFGLHLTPTVIIALLNIKYALPEGKA